MAEIGGMEYGCDAAGVSNYISEVRVKLLDTASNRLKDTSAIRNVCEQEWEGQARENFLSNLDKDIEHVIDQFTSLIQVFESEVNSIQAAMANKDQELIKLD